MPFLEAGVGPGAIDRNWASYGAEVTLDPGLPDTARRLICDPQTSGGLLVACNPEQEAAVLAAYQAAGFGQAVRIGTLEAGTPGIRVA